jgi:DNA-binding NarL/FixJ family response regulator
MDVPPPRHELRILIADDHAIVREGLKRVLQSACERWTVVEADDGFQALEQVREQAFDLAIFDLTMPGLGGLDLLQRVHAHSARLPVLILSMRAEEQFATRALQAGARGYVTKDTAASDLVAAVRKVIAGGVYVSPSLTDRLVLQWSGAKPAGTLDQLSDRELEVLRRLVAGQRQTEIAAALHLSVKTVSSHKARLQEKLQLSGTAALVRFGLAQGLGAEDESRPLATP